MEKILLIDDDVELCAMLVDYLGRHDYDITVIHRGDSGLEKALAGSYSLILLDVMLPGMDGFEVLRRLRASSSISVMLLTARGDDVDRIVGLEIGADDYLPKPFNPRELLARVRAIGRRTGQQVVATTSATHQSIPALGLELDSSARTARCADAVLSLTDVEFDLLKTLMRFAGEVVEREQLASIVLERKFNPFDRSLDMHISRLRNKLEKAAKLGHLVKTIRGRGYQLALPSLGKGSH